MPTCQDETDWPRKSGSSDSFRFHDYLDPGSDRPTWPKHGKVDGSRGRGRRRTSWITNIAEMTNMRVNAAARAAIEREGWRSMASNLLKEKEPS
ncbi:hypothetical protein ElyMa_001942600 [Elysia marginata]|uniref:Uncharacterized protein n=1 Tax=Elysia marginata TaxID=1093978 RepID=A0AAV4EW03_9GAST|nr:hypothetical protein ElyMa_001942600 [Elysia marginata]